MWNADNSYLLKYISEIEYGNILVGQELWLELSRLKEDFHNDRYITTPTRLICTWISWSIVLGLQNLLFITSLWF